MSRLRSASNKLIAMSLFLGVAALGSAWPWSASKEIKIGFVAQLTGGDSYIGQAAKLALEDRIKELNSRGGLAGRQVQLITYDSRTQPTEVVAATRRLIEHDDVVAVIGPEWTAASIPLGPISEQAKIPVITTTASNVKVTLNNDNSVKPFMFRTCFIDPYQGFALADFAYKDLKKRRAAFIYDVGSAYSMGIMQYFEDAFTKRGGQVVAKEGFQALDTEFRAQLSKVAKTNPDVLVVPVGTYRDIALIAKQADALGLRFQYLGVDGWVNDELLTLAGRELEGAYLSSGLSTADPKFKAYNENFLKAHNVKATIFAYYALDAMYMLEYAITTSVAKVHKVDPVAIKNELENMKDVPVFTSNLTIEPKTHNPHNKPIVIMAIRGSKWNISKTYAPAD